MASFSPAGIGKTSDAAERESADDELMDLICDVVGTIPSPTSPKHSGELDVYDIMDVTSSSSPGHFDRRVEDRGSVASGRSAEDSPSNNSDENMSMYMAYIEPSESDAAHHAQPTYDPVSAFLSLGPTRDGDASGSSAMGVVADSADGARVFNKYETQPASVLRQQIQTMQKRDIEKAGTRYSTTGSYKAVDSLHSPNNKQIMYCTAAILQAEVIAGINSASAKCPEFEVESDLPEDLFPDREEVSRSGHALDRRASFEFMIRFITYIYTRMKYQPECNIVALIYVNRMTAETDLVLTPSNWHNVWLCSIIIAQKMWEDTAFKTSSFVSLVPGVTKKELRDMEWRLLGLIKFDIFIKASLYTKYYFELRQMYKELGLELGEMSVNKPLTNVKERQLEERSSKRRPVRRSDIRQHEAQARARHSPSGGAHAMAADMEKHAAALASAAAASKASSQYKKRKSVESPT